MAAEGVTVTMREVVEAVVRHAAGTLAPGAAHRAPGLLVVAGPRPAGVRRRGLGRGARPRSEPGARPPPRRRRGRPGPGRGDLEPQARVRARLRLKIGPEMVKLRSTMRELSLVTVCEEAGCPNIFECWADGTATFMINGERCTRACGFCLVDTSHPLPLDPGEPEHVAEAVARMGLSHAVVTAVARDDLADGGALAFAETIAAIRRRSPGTTVEVLIPDCKGDEAALDIIFDARPDVLNHNLETVNRLQRAVRPSASYARSLSVLARSAAPGSKTKSGIILGMGESARRGRGRPRRPSCGRRRDRHARPVPAPDRRAPARRPLVGAGRVRRAGRHGPGDGHLLCRGLALDPLELPRQAGGHRAPRPPRSALCRRGS